MKLFLTALVSGIPTGLTFGLLAFALVSLYKCTGVANFAQGQTGTFAVFLLLPLFSGVHVPVVLLLLLVMAAGAVIGVVSYLICERVNEQPGHLNSVIRTLGLYFLIGAILIKEWATGEPYRVPSLVPGGHVNWGPVSISYLSIASAGIALVLAIGFSQFFKRTRPGLILLGIAENRAVAQLLGVRVRRYDLAAWATAGILSGLVGFLVAPAQLLTTSMLDDLLLYALAAAILAGLDNLEAVWLGALAVGIVSNLSSVYVSSEISLTIVFGMVLVGLIVRPQGILGRKTVARL